MAVDYTTLFTRLGRLVKWSNTFIDFQNTNLLGTNAVADDVLDEYTARRDLVGDFQKTVEGWAGAPRGWADSLRGVVDRTLADLQTELNTPSSDPQVILSALATRMVTDTQTIENSAIGTPTLTAGAGNDGTGAGKASIADYANTTDERIITETVLFECVSDRFSGATAGGEQFSVTGYPKIGASTYGVRGNGGGNGITVCNEGGQQRVPNGNFDTFTTNTPGSWTVAAGTIGTHILAESTIVQHTGTKALKLDGDGSATTVTLNQTIATRMVSRTKYAFGVWLRKGGTVSAGSTLAIRVTGTGFSTVNVYNADPTGLTTSFVLFSTWINIGDTVPTDLTVEITWTSANTAGATAEIYVDDLVIAPVSYFGHVAYAIFRGATDFLRGDTITVNTSNDEDGIFQTYFGRFYDAKLPSSSSPTIADTLAA